MTPESIVNHLWQSSCFALLAGLLAFALRKNSPKVRYWVWLSASLKFLVPFALLVSVGSVVPRPSRQAASVPAPFSRAPWFKSRNHFRQLSRPLFPRTPHCVGFQL